MKRIKEINLINQKNNFNKKSWTSKIQIAIITKYISNIRMN